MTARSVILGLLGAAFVCGYTYFNDHVMQQTMFVGNNMPYSVYGGLILFLLAVNPLVLLAGRMRTPALSGLAAGLVSGCVTAVAGGLAAGVGAGSAATGVLAGLVAGLLVGLTTALVAANVPEKYGGAVCGVASCAIGGLVAGIAGGSIAGAFTGVAAAVVAGLAGSRRALSARELAVVLCLTLAACSIPGSGLMRTFTNAIMMPHHMAPRKVGWQSEEVIEMAPAQMLAGTSPRVRPDDILDPRGLCLAMARDGEGEGTGPASRVGGRIWSFLSETDRQAIREAAVQALAGPDERARARCEARLARVLDRELERASEEEEDEQEGEGREAEKSPRLSQAGVEAIASAVRQALAPPGPESPATVETVRALGALAERLGVSDEARGDISAAMLDALEPPERPCRLAAARALNSVLARRDLYDPRVFEGVTLPAEADRILDREVNLSLPPGEELPVGRRRLPERIERLSEEDLRTLNRHLVDAAWPKGIYGHAARRNEELNAFVLGKDQFRGRVSLGEIPWSAWWRPLVFWVPLILLMWIGLIGLAVVVHRQWSRHEQLAYPIAKFADALLPAPGRAMGGVFSDRLFWMASGTILAIHMTNYAHAWWPSSLVRIPTQFNFGDLLWSKLFSSVFETLRSGGAWWRVFQLRIFFTVVAVAYFVASDVSLSLGVGPVIFCFISGILVSYGISSGGGGFYSANIEKMTRAGAYFGILAMILYTGRHYYLIVLRRTFCLRAREEIEEQAVWGARVFLVCMAAFTVDLALAGLDWQLAVFYTAASVVMFVVMGRIIAETGLFFIQPFWFPGIILTGFLGIRALGPSTALFMFLVSAVLLIDPREALMPYVANSFKLLELRKVRMGGAAIWTGAAVILGLAVAFPVTLMFQYGAGTGRVDSWATEAVPQFAFEQTVKMKQRLKAQDALEESESVSGFARLGHAKWEKVGVYAFLVGLGLVLLFSLARLRLPWWPLHPVMFVAWNIYAGYMFAFSFLLGWFIKTMVTKYGGERVYQKLKPLFFGMIAGDMLGGIIPSLIGAVYYLVTNEVPKSFQVLPH